MVFKQSSEILEAKVAFITLLFYNAAILNHYILVFICKYFHDFRAVICLKFMGFLRSPKIVQQQVIGCCCKFLHGNWYNWLTDLDAIFFLQLSEMKTDMQEEQLASQQVVEILEKEKSQRILVEKELQDACVSCLSIWAYFGIKAHKLGLVRILINSYLAFAQQNHRFIL